MIRAALVWSFALLTTVASAQDRRVVSEPRVPHICATLEASLGGPDGRITAADESRHDTPRIQAAIDRCPAGTAVELRAAAAHRVFIAAPLELRSGITLLVSESTVLAASRNARDYDITPGSCGTVDDRGGGCRPLIRVNGARDAGIMGDGIIDGRGGEPIAGRHESWWDLAQDAKVRNAHQNVPRLIVADRADNFVLYRITLRHSPNFHAIVSRTKGFTAWGVRIDAPATARNTDGIDPSSSTDVTIVHSFIRCGDDNIAIKAGDNGPAGHMTIAHNHFYSGHGMSIGSETNGGVTAIVVDDLTIDGADNGLRIKSNRTRGGIVEQVTYRDVCMRAVKHPVVIDREYDGVTSGPLEPRYEDIRYENVHIAERLTLTACENRFVPFPDEGRSTR
jgi:polygalacturonase